MAYDKKWHLILSLAACLALMVILEMFLPQATALQIAAGVTLTISAAKELIYDWYLGKGTPEWADFAADCAGVAVAVMVRGLV